MLKSVDHSGPQGQTPVEYQVPSEQRRPGRAMLIAKAFLQAAIVFAILVGAVQVMNTLVATRPEVPKRAAQERSYAAETAVLVKGSHTPTISVFGEATAGRTVDLRTLVGGEVVSVHPELKAGGLVKKDDELVVIDSFDFEGAVTEARANLAEAEAGLVESKGRVELERANVVRAREQLEFAQRDLDRAEDLIARGSVTERTVDERRLLVSQRQQTLEQRQNALTLEEAKVRQQEAAIQRLEWRLRNARRQLENTVLKAPFDAVVRAEGAQRGRLVGVNDVVASIYARDELEVRFTLSDNQYGRLVAEAGTVVGRPVNVTWSLGNRVLSYDAVIDRIGADVASTRGGVDVFARVTLQEDQTPLRPGAFVEVFVPDQTYDGSFRIPETAYYGQGTVYVVEEERLIPRTVEALALDGQHLIVRGDLQTGEVVLTTRIPEAGEGLRVRPVADGQPGETPAAARAAQTSTPAAPAASVAQ
ncbi:hypothetical protein GCM10011316_24120 [Roseibium aquae]|uniref:RND family efflux transporter MFP subunit n=1 Tax=Roseibium aquae TaxID=1323746 RepID=A0A916X2B6_9HYPH|nr:HlyD family efflux transporter periplasmic adaptor subunit [Roseibium aquae]GGB51279.1 hypothetical protein GCM10011316_24120 [Roseibium aquae]